MKKVQLNTQEEIKHILPDVIVKDLKDNEEICPLCHGLGVKLWNNSYGIKGDTSEAAKKSMFPYKHQSLLPCPNCYDGVVKICEFCGKQLPKGRLKCDCEQQKNIDAKERKVKYQEIIGKAKEISWKDTSYYVYDENSDKYFTDEIEFADYYWELYLDEKEISYCNFDSYFENYVPKVLWNCYKAEISLNADYIIDSACEELHEDARDNITGEKELQDYLDKWCKKQSRTTTYYPYYKEYVKVEKEWFDEQTKVLRGKNMKTKCKNGFYDNRHLEPKKPFKQEIYDFEKIGYCPSCSFNDGTIFQLVFQRYNYCPNCGQELDWD